MGIIRPVLTNFRLGEVDPRLAGRVDLGLAVGAADKIENAHTIEYGGVYKRGGLEYKAIIDVVARDHYRIIPWSIDDEHDILLILTDIENNGNLYGRIFLYDTKTSSFLKDESNDIIVVDGIQWNGTVVPLYSGEDIYNVHYVTSKNIIYLVHQNYPPMYIKVDQADIGYVVTYSAFNIVSNLLVTQEPDTKDTNIVEFSSSTVISILKDYVNNDLSQSVEEKTFTTADGVEGSIYINGVEKTVAKVYVKRESVNRKAYIKLINIPINPPNYTITDASSVTDVQNAIKRVDNSSYCQYTGTSYRSRIETEKKWVIFTNHHYRFDLDGAFPERVTTPVITSANDFLNWCAANMISDTTYYISIVKNIDIMGPTMVNNRPEHKNVRSIKYTAGSTKYTVIFYDASDNQIATMSSSGESNLVGWFDIDSYGISVNGDGKTTTAVNGIIDTLSPWLLKDKIYKCSDRYEFCGKTIDTVVKRVTEKGPVIDVRAADGTVITIDKTMSQINGRIGVRLTPIINQDDFPGCITIWQNRLCIGGSRASPNVVYMSKVNDYFDFTFFEDVEYTSTVMTPEEEWADPDVPQYETIKKVVQQTGADNAIQFSIMTEENEAISGLCGGQHLFISTTTSEFIVPAGSTAINFNLQLVSRNGGSRIQPKFIQNMITYIGQSLKKVFVFSPEQQVDLFTYAKHIINAPIRQIDYASDPSFGIYITLSNGTLLYGIPNEGTMAWHRYSTSGDIKSCAVIRQSDEDAVYLVVIRSGIAMLERLRNVYSFEFENRPYLDCYVYQESVTPLTTIDRDSIPLPNNANVVIHYIDNNDVEGEIQYKLTSSDITVPNVVKVYIGLPFNMVVKTWRIDTSDTEGIAKNVESVFFRLYNSSGFTLVKDNMEYFDVMIPDYDGINQVLYNGIVKYDALSPWDTDKQIHIESNTVYPVNILNIMPQLATGEVV